MRHPAGFAAGPAGSDAADGGPDATTGADPRPDAPSGAEALPTTSAAGLPPANTAQAQEAAVGAGSDDVYQQIGLMTRQLHDTLQRLGVMPKLQHAAAGLPDARSRLSYIAQKCGDAADRVLTSVELAKAEHQRIGAASARIARALASIPREAAMAAGPGDAEAEIEAGANADADDVALLRAAVAELDGARARADAHLTDIMLAQDYHDLTGQVVAKVVSLAIELEDGLLALLLRGAPAEPAGAAGTTVGLEGPAIDARARPDVVADQSEVDDLLASLGF